MLTMRELAERQKGEYVYQDYDLVAMLEAAALELRDLQLKEYTGGYYVLEARIMQADGALDTVKFWSRDEPTPEDKGMLGPVSQATVRYGEYTDDKKVVHSSWKWIDADGRSLSGGKREYEEEGE